MVREDGEVEEVWCSNLFNVTRKLMYAKYNFQVISKSGTYYLPTVAYVVGQDIYECIITLCHHLVCLLCCLLFVFSTYACTKCLNLLTVFAGSVLSAAPELWPYTIPLTNCRRGFHNFQVLHAEVFRNSWKPLSRHYFVVVLLFWSHISRRL